MYAWLYDKSPVDSFLIGTRNEHQFNAVLNALSVQLSNTDWQELDNLLSVTPAPE
jgi:aryl-alcohol dehydrogenase-like predicted oxidoreductase